MGVMYGLSDIVLREEGREGIMHRLRKGGGRRGWD